MCTNPQLHRIDLHIVRKVGERFGPRIVRDAVEPKWLEPKLATFDNMITMMIMMIRKVMITMTIKNDLAVYISYWIIHNES